MTQIDGATESDEEAGARSERSQSISPKSDEYLKWLAQFRPPIVVKTKDGRTYTTRFDHLDAQLDAIRRGEL